MTCAATEERLSDYLDGTLLPEERAQVDAHLEGCEHCRQDLEELRFVVEMLHQVPQEDVPEGLGARIHEALAALPDEEAPAPTVVSIDEARARKGGAAPWWKRFSVTSAAAGAAVAVFVFALWNMQPSSLPRIETAAVSVSEDVAVNIGFTVDSSVEGVTYQIDLPEGLQFVDEASQPMLAQSVSWKGALKEGKTVIPIVVRGVRPGRYEIQATVRKGPMMQQTTIVLPVEATS